MLGDAGELVEALLLRLAQSEIVAEYTAPGPDAETSAALNREEWRAFQPNSSVQNALVASGSLLRISA